MGFKDWLWEKEILNEMGWENLPTGWTRKSLLKCARSLTGKTKSDNEGFFTECHKKLKSHFGDEGAKKMCASLKDEVLGKTTWRGKKDK